MQLTAVRLFTAVTVLVAFAWPAVADEEALPQVIDLAVTGDKVHSQAVARSGGPPVIRVQQGRTVELRWTSDRDVTVHLHGSEIEAHVQRGGAARMHLVARAAGRFPIESHGRDGHVTLLYLEVHP